MTDEEDNLTPSEHPHRHCEERSDAAISYRAKESRLPRPDKSGLAMISNAKHLNQPRKQQVKE